MFRSLLRIVSSRQAQLCSAFFLLNTVPSWLRNEENERINQKLKKKLNEKFHNRKDISFELTEEFRYFFLNVEKIWLFFQVIQIEPLLNKSQKSSKLILETLKLDGFQMEKSA